MPFKLKKYCLVLMLLINLMPVANAQSSVKVTVPDVTGYSLDQAKSKLELRGFDIEVIFGGPAPEEEDAFKVYEQSVYPSLRVERGQKIILSVYDKFKLQKEDAQNRLSAEPKGEPLTHSISMDANAPERKKSRKR